MNIGLYCKYKEYEYDVVFCKEVDPEILNTCDKLIFLDYGVSFDISAMHSFMTSAQEVVVIPVPLSTVDWKMFAVKTVMSSLEPPSQRALTFDVSVKPIGELERGVSEYLRGDGRIIAYDCKSVLKKNKKSVLLSDLKKSGVKIGVLTNVTATSVNVYECIGNVLETSGIKVGYPDGPDAEHQEICV
jgi:hypothetical protein